MTHRRHSMTKFVRCCAATLILLQGYSAVAAEIPPGLRTWLMAIEALPNPEQLRRAGGPLTEKHLDAVVSDVQEPIYARHRALSLLGSLDSPKAVALLQAQLRNRDTALRATAVVAWLGGVGRRDSKLALKFADKLLRDPEPSVRAAAARALTFVQDPAAARVIAAKARAHENSDQVQPLLDRTIRELDQRMGNR